MQETRSRTVLHTICALGPALRLSPDVCVAKRLKLLWTFSRLSYVKLSTFINFWATETQTHMVQTVSLYCPPGFLPEARSCALEIFLSLYPSWSSPPNFLERHSPVTRSCGQRHEWGTGRALGWESGYPSTPCPSPQRLPCLKTSAGTCALHLQAFHQEEFESLHSVTTRDLPFKTTPRSLP